ncbi:MAG: hypothetical protein ACOC1F_02370 [Myxococcota bacterium]
MARTVDVRAVSGILFGVYKSLYEIAGASAPAVMRRAAPDILNELQELGVDFTGVNSIEKLEDQLRETMVKSGCCDEMTFKLDGNELRADITNCSFYPLTSALKEKGIPPFGCPFAAITIAVAERNLGKKARVKHLAPSEGGKPGDTTLIVELHDR